MLQEKRQVASGPSLRRVKLCFDFTVLKVRERPRRDWGERLHGASCVPSRLGVRAAKGLSRVPRLIRGALGGVGCREYPRPRPLTVLAASLPARAPERMLTQSLCTRSFLEIGPLQL